MVESLQHGTTLTSELYCKPLNKVHRARHSEANVQNADVSNAMLLYQNEHPHTATHSSALLVHFNWELFDYPVYLPEEMVVITAFQ
jgi:hypothetical protein